MNYYIIIVSIILSLYLFIGILNYHEYHYNKSKMNCDCCEGFTPSIRETYRPYFRNTRMYCNGLYYNTKNRMHNMFRKIGLF
jgi:hypothetical protein